MNASNNTTAANGLDETSEFLVGSSAEAVKISGTIVVKKPGRLLEIGAKSGFAAISENPEAALCTFSAVVIVYHAGKGV